MMGPHESSSGSYPHARVPGAGGYASSTDAPHETTDEEYPVARDPDGEDY